MKSATLWLSIITFALIVITLGCGFAIHYGGQAFKDAVKGHAVLGVITLIVSLTAVLIQLISR